MFFVWALALTGLFLLALEFFLPGGIMAIGASVLFLASVFVFHQIQDGVQPLVIYTLVLGAASYLIVRIAKSRLRKAPPLNSTDLFQATLYPKEWVGKKGRAATDLDPAGKVWVDEQTYDARALTGKIEKGASIQILEGRGPLLIVKSSPE